MRKPCFSTHPRRGSENTDAACGCLVFYCLWMFIGGIAAHLDAQWFEAVWASDFKALAYWLQWPTPCGLTVRQRLYQVFAYYWDKPTMINAKHFYRGVDVGTRFAVALAPQVMQMDPGPFRYAYVRLDLWCSKRSDPNFDTPTQVVFAVKYDPKTCLPNADMTYWAAVQWYCCTARTGLCRYPIYWRMNNDLARWLLLFYHGGAPYDSVPVPPDPGNVLPEPKPVDYSEQAATHAE